MIKQIRTSRLSIQKSPPVEREKGGRSRPQEGRTCCRGGACSQAPPRKRSLVRGQHAPHTSMSLNQSEHSHAFRLEVKHLETMKTTTRLLLALLVEIVVDTSRDQDAGCYDGGREKGRGPQGGRACCRGGTCGLPLSLSLGDRSTRRPSAPPAEREWYFIAEQPAPAHPEECAALRIVLVTVALASISRMDSISTSYKREGGPKRTSGRYGELRREVQGEECGGMGCRV